MRDLNLFHCRNYIKPELLCALSLSVKKLLAHWMWSRWKGAGNKKLPNKSSSRKSIRLRPESILDVTTNFRSSSKRAHSSVKWAAYIHLIWYYVCASFYQQRWAAAERIIIKCIERDTRLELHGAQTSLVRISQVKNIPQPHTHYIIYIQGAVFPCVLAIIILSPMGVGLKTLFLLLPSPAAVKVVVKLSRIKAFFMK